MKDQPPLPQPIWDTMSAEAQAAVSALAESFERRIARLEERLGKNSTNSSRPPSSDPPSVKRRPPSPPSGKKHGPSHDALLRELHAVLVPGRPTSWPGVRLRPDG